MKNHDVLQVTRKHRFANMKKMFVKRGWLCTILYYWRRIKAMIFSMLVFGRVDIRVFPDARLGGISHMEIGYGFAAGRGLWLEAVTDYSVAGQMLSPRLIIGKHVNVGEYVHIGCNNQIIIGNDVLMGSKIYITDHNHGIYRGDHQDTPDVPPANRPLTEGESVIIGNRCWIGEFVSILPGVTIGDGTIIGSHSTVTHDIPANSIAVGSPARVVKQWSDVEKAWVRI